MRGRGVARLLLALFIAPLGSALAESPPPSPYLTLSPAGEPLAAPRADLAPFGTTPPPPRVHYERQPRSAFIISGCILFGLGYTLASGIGVMTRGYAAVVPIAGPLFFWSGRSQDAGQNVAYLLDALLQATGVALAIAGAATRHDVLVVDRISFAPLLLPGGAGLGAATRF